jgi:hypothetical protein
LRWKAVKGQRSKHPLDPTQDGEILKYFLVERPSAKRKVAAPIAAERNQA